MLLLSMMKEVNLNVPDRHQQEPSLSMPTQLTADSTFYVLVEYPESMAVPLELSSILVQEAVLMENALTQKKFLSAPVIMETWSSSLAICQRMDLTPAGLTATLRE